MTYSNEGLEFACDELAETIDAGKGLLVVEVTIAERVKIVCDQDDGIDPIKFLAAMLEKFEELYLCDPYVYAENSQWAYEVGESDDAVIDVLDIEDDLISLDDLDGYDEYR